MSAIEQLNVAIEIDDHLPDLIRLSLRDYARVKMMLLFHYMHQNGPFSRDWRGFRTVWRRNRKNLAKLCRPECISA
jgi:hypothetical protein